MGILARGGFSFEMSKRILDLKHPNLKTNQDYLVSFFLPLPNYQVF